MGLVVLWFGFLLVFVFLPSYINNISQMHLPRFSFLNHLVSHRVVLLGLRRAMKEEFSFDGYQGSLGKGAVLRGSRSPWFSCYLSAFFFFNSRKTNENILNTMRYPELDSGTEKEH